MAIIINGRGRVGARPSSGGGTPTPSYLLDTYSGAAVAYSLRKLSSTYSGNCIRVRRSSDNAEQNIGFVSNVLDTASLLSFVGAGNGFVVTWYDQSGNANNAAQYNATTQPQIVLNGSIHTLNGKPTIYGSSKILGQASAVNAVSSFFVANYTSLNIANYINNKVGLGGSYTGIDGVYMNDGTNSIGSTIESTSTKLVSCLSLTTGNTSRLFVNNTAQGTSTILNNSNVSHIFANPNNAGALSNIGNMSEVIYYASNKYTDFTGINTNINTYYSIYPSDSDAAAFVSAAGITNSTQMSAVNTLVTSLKSSGVWAKMKAIYPVVGGNATAHSKNLKNPSQYNLTFSSGWSHSSNGMTPNGSAYASTSLIPSSALSTNSTHISYYSRTNKLGSNECEMGTNQVQNEKNLYMCYDAYNTNYIGVNQYGDSTGTRLPNTLGMLLLSRNDSTQFNKFFNNSKEVITHHNATTTHPLAGTATKQMTLGCIRDGDTTNRLYSTKECAFSTIGDGLTDSEASAFYTAVQAFQTTLGRQV
jgi:hypothetical protein